MPKKQKPKVSTIPTAPEKMVSPETLKKAYRLVKRSSIPAGKRTVPPIGLDDIVAFSQTPEGMSHTIAGIHCQGGPLYTTDPKHPGLVVEVLPDGTKRLGRLENRTFIEDVTQGME